MTVLARRYDGPREAQAGEGRALLAFLDRIFASHGLPKGMAGEYPHLYGDMERRLAWCRVVTHGGRLVAHTGIYPLDFIVGGRTVRAGGIGAVASDPRHRGRGLMSALLEDATARMRERGMPLSILWGDRARYARFGWEGAGSAVGFTLHPAAVGFMKRYDLPVTELRRPGEHAAALHAVHRTAPARVERSPEVFAGVLAKHGRRVFAVRRGRNLAAYAVVRSWRRGRGRTAWQAEELAGSPAGVLSILRALAAKAGTDRVAGDLPAAYVPHARGVLAGADCWSLSVRCLGQLKVVDRDALLAVLGVTRLAGPLRAARLAPLELPRVLFGPVPPRVLLPPGRIRDRLAAALPIPLYLFHTDHV